MKDKGILLTQGYDMAVKVRRDGTGKITQGWVVGNVTYQNQVLMLYAQKGEIKEFPTVGVGIDDVLNDNDFSLWKREITEQLEDDGLVIETLEIDAKGMKLEAYYS